MHEIDITQHILKDVIKIAESKTQKGNRNSSSTGTISGFVPECIQMYMDLLAKDTICHGVQIKVKEIPLKVYCNQCHKEALIDRKHIECPFVTALI